MAAPLVVSGIYLTLGLAFHGGRPCVVEESSLEERPIFRFRFHVEQSRVYIDP